MVLAGPQSVVVADDHAPTRAAVRHALERGGFSVFAEAGDAPGAVSAVRETNPQIALLDIRMPGDGLTAAAAIASERPQTAIVMLTVSEDDSDLFGALRAGASGYLLKGMNPGTLPDALRGILAGEAALSGTLVARLITEFRTRERRRFFTGPSPRGQRLTEREWDVLELMEQGLRTAEIAERLFVAKVTVRSHVAAILRKLQVADREAAVRLLRHGTA